MHPMKYTAIVCFFLIVSSTISEASVIKKWSFEDSNPFHDLKVEGEKPSVVIDPLVPNNHVMKAVLLKTSSRPERSELRFDGIGFQQERWIGVRIMVPEKSIQPFLSLFQLGPIYGIDKLNGGGWYQLLAKPGSLLTWNIRGFMERIHESPVREKAGPIELGKWTNWVMHFKLNDDSNGFVEMWKNGVKVYEKHGRNAIKGDRIPVKWGIYIGIGNKLLQDITVYFDDIVYCNESSNLEEITASMNK